jgi:methylmalonyl-CoA mutase
VPPQDYEALRNAGVAEIFAPGTTIADAAARLLEGLNRRLGYAQKTAAE